jgi:outer membrane lipoprotein SlyB
MLKIVTFVLLCIALLFVMGCGHQQAGTVYSRGAVGQAQTVEEGEVILVRQVKIEGSRSGIGTIAGGYLGYKGGKALSRNIGSSSGSSATKVAGAVGGAVGGRAVERKATEKTGLEVTVRLENGRVISVVQPSGEQFDIGDKVRVLIRPDGSAMVLQ